MKRFVFALIMSVLALQGCETRFELKGMSEDPKIYVYGIAGMSDTTSFRVCKTVPVSGMSDPSASREVSSIELTVDGKAVTLTKADADTPGVPKGY